MGGFLNIIKVWQLPTLTWGDPTLPSALRHFTSEFGMGSGGTTALLPPNKFFSIYPVLFRCLTVCSPTSVANTPRPSVKFDQIQSQNKLKFSLSKHLRCCQVKPLGSLVLVSSTYRYAYTPSLSTSSSRTPLIGHYCQGRLILRQVSRLDAFSGYLFRT